MSKCTGCGGCCSTLLPLSKGEIKDIRQYVKKHKIKPVMTLGTLDCPFCDPSKTKNRCLIYPIRPWICRMFHCDYVDNELRVSNHNLRVKREVVNMQVLFGRGNNGRE